MSQPTAARDVHRSHEAAYAHAVDRIGETRRHLTVAGVDIQLRVAGAPLADRLLPALTETAATEPEPVRGADHRLPVILRAWDSATSGVAPPSSPWSPSDFLPRDEVRGSGDDGVDVAYSVAWRTLSVWDRVGRSGTYWIHDATAMPYWEPTAPFRYLLHWALADQGCVLAHAAAVGGPDGAVLLVGAGGSGKSTSALACIEAGWSYVSDDYCVLDTIGPPAAHALYRVGKLDDRSAELLPDLLRRTTAPTFLGPKRVLDLSRWAPDPTVGALPLRAIVVPRVAATTGRPRPLAPATGLRALAPSTLFQLPGTRTTALTDLGRAIAELPVWGLDVGPDVDRIPAVLAAVLASPLSGPPTGPELRATNRPVGAPR